jgi:hypothetical protein
MARFPAIMSGRSLGSGPFDRHGNRSSSPKKFAPAASLLPDGSALALASPGEYQRLRFALIHTAHDRTTTRDANRHASNKCGDEICMGMRVWDLVVSLDFGQFYLTSDAAGAEASADPMSTLNRALEGDGIARTDGFLVVLSPHQNNSSMRLRIEVHESEPPEDLDAWQEAFQAWLPVDESGVFYESPDADSTAAAATIKRGIQPFHSPQHIVDALSDGQIPPL